MKKRSLTAHGPALSAVAVAALLCAVAPASWALGLGRVTVQSALGEALRAEIDVTSISPEEAATLRLRVASPEAYRAAGVDYNPVLPGTSVQLQRRPDGRFDVATRRGLQFIAKTVFIAGGVGAFQPKPLRVEGLAAFEGTQLHYRVDDAARFAGRHVVVVGGGDSALHWANQLAEAGPQAAASVTLLHRRDVFQAEPAAISRMRALCEAHRMQFAAGQVSGIEVTDGRLTAIKVLGGGGVTRVMPLDELLVFFGLSPRLGPIADWGLALERKQLVVDTEKFETSEPGIFAVGDVVTYPGKKKLILCGFHEATLAAFGAVRHVFPDKAVHLQYTTTSPRLHQLLGVETPSHDDEH